MKTWNTEDGTITEADLDRMVDLMKAGPLSHGYLAVEMRWTRDCDRRLDRALTKLRKAGRIEFDRAIRKWRVKEGAK